MWRRTGVLCAGVCVLISWGAATAGAAERAAAPTTAPHEKPVAQRAETAGERLVREALEAEAAGQADRRASLLREARQVAPDFAPAHWHAGEVRLGDRWVHVDDVAAEATRAGQADAYRKLREKSAATAADQLKLAAWCEKAGLPALEQVHLYLAYLLQPAKPSREVVEKLGLVRHDKQYLPADVVQSIQRDARQGKKSVTKWAPRVKALREELESAEPVRRESAERELRAIRDPAAVEPLLAAFATSAPDVASLVVATIAAMPQQSATEGLLVAAIYAPHTATREEAAAALRQRSMYAYVPRLMGALRSPIDVQFSTYEAAGTPRHQLRLYQEGPLSDQVFISSGGASAGEEVVVARRTGQTTFRGPKFYPDQTLERDAAAAQRAVQQNASIERANERITTVLRNVTGQDYDATPTKWWDWWLDYNEMYRPSMKPVATNSRYYLPPSPGYSYRYVSCFAAGTTVWTIGGPVPIEQVQPGEFVVAQDPATGEVAYRPVMATTVRPPSPCLDIQAGGATVRGTRGHPFWVCGAGWRMAKELQAGDWLHTLSGPVEIESVTPAVEDVCYNLVVAGFGNFFIGDARVLVHDNTIRDVTPATVPGLLSDE